MKLEPYHFGTVVALLMLLLATTKTVSLDVAIAIVQVMLGIAPIAGIVENYRMKTGWSVNTTMTVSMGLLVIGSMMFLAQLPITAGTVLFSSAMYGILAMQAFKYRGPA